MNIQAFSGKAEVASIEREHTSGPPGWAVVGLGRHARGRILPALRRARNARLVGLCTRKVTVAQELAHEYGVRAFDTFDAVLADPKVKIVYLATPHDLHAEQTMRCAAAAKHVLVEKPMALSLEDAIAMVEACAQAHVKLYVGFHLRFHPAHQRARQAVRSGEIGDIVWADARWISHKEADVGWRVNPMRSGGDILTARGIHLIDLIRFVCGTEFESIAGISDGFKPGRGADAVTAGFGNLVSGGFAHFVCTRLPRRVANGFDVYGTQGAVSCCSTMATESSGLLSAGTLTISRGSRTETIPYGPCDAFVEECDCVSDAITLLSGSSRLCAADGEDGKHATAVALGLVTSVETGRTVMLRREPAA